MLAVGQCVSRWIVCLARFFSYGAGVGITYSRISEFTKKYTNIPFGRFVLGCMSSLSCTFISSLTYFYYVSRANGICSPIQIQCGLICGAIEEFNRSLKAIDKCVFINLCDKNAVFTNFQQVFAKIMIGNLFQSVTYWYQEFPVPGSFHFLVV